MHSLSITLALTVQLAALFTLGVERGVDFYDPTHSGGSMLDNAGNGYGEPLNVIISGMSSPEVLTNDGIINFARAIGFAVDCLTRPSSANLGDGNGWVSQTMELRQDDDAAIHGLCPPGQLGGNRFRVFRQNGTLQNSGALFLAASQEVHISDPENRTVVPDGYNIGRDALVAYALGSTSYGGVSYSTKAENITGLLAPGADSVNFGISQDGIVTLLTVTIV